MDSDFREQAIRDVADACGVLKDDIEFYMGPKRSSSELARYAVEQRARVLQLESCISGALHMIYDGMSVRSVLMVALEAKEEG